MIANSPAADAVAEQLLASGERIRPVFEGLDLQWSLDDAAEYLMATPTMQALDETTAHRVVGLAAAFAAVAVERDRELDAEGGRA